MLTKIRDFVKNNASKVFLAIAIVLLVSLALGFGLNIGAKLFSRPALVIHSELLPASSLPNSNTDISYPGLYVASIIGKYYYTPDCSGAQQLKEENKIWFNSKEEAESRGYKPSPSCL